MYHVPTALPINFRLLNFFVLSESPQSIPDDPKPTPDPSLNSLKRVVSISNSTQDIVCNFLIRIVGPGTHTRVVTRKTDMLTVL
jgi:hypothetical protein